MFAIVSPTPWMNVARSTSYTPSATITPIGATQRRSAVIGYLLGETKPARRVDSASLSALVQPGGAASVAHAWGHALS